MPRMRLNREVKLNYGNWMNKGKTKNQRHTHKKRFTRGRPLWLFHRIPPESVPSVRRDQVTQKTERTISPWKTGVATEVT